MHTAIWPHTNIVRMRIKLLVYCLITDWVVQLGPPTFKGNYYQYSVVSGPGKYGLFVLTRNITEFKQNYDEEVLTKLKAQGFTIGSTTSLQTPTREMTVCMFSLNCYLLSVLSSYLMTQNENRKQIL